MKKLTLLILGVLLLGHIASAQTFKTPFYPPQLCPGVSLSESTDGQALTWYNTGLCWRLSALPVTPVLTTPTHTFTHDSTLTLYNPGRGVSLDTNNSNVAILPWDAATMTPKRTYVSIYKWDYNVCDGQASATACENMTTPTAGAISNLATWCSSFRTAGYKVRLKLIWYYAGYKNPTLTRWQNVMSAMTNSIRACEDITLSHMMAFGEFSEQWGSYNLTAGSHNSWNYAPATSIRQTYDNILQKKQACFRRPDYMENTGIEYPLATPAAYFGTTGSAAVCQQQDSPMADNTTEAGTYGVNGNNETQQRTDDKEHSKYTIKTGEFWEQGISGTNYQTYSAATTYLSDYHFNDIRIFANAASNLCPANPCTTASGIMGSYNNGAGQTFGQWLDKYLGYRIYLTSATLPTTVSLDSPFSYSFTFGNAGTSAIAEGKLFQLILKSGGGTVYRVPIWNTPYTAGNDSKNPRAWLPGVASTATGQLIIATGTVPAGTYNVGLAIPDGESTLRTGSNTALFSVRFANTASPSGGNGGVTWDSGAANGLNMLLKSDGNPVTIVVN